MIVVSAILGFVIIYNLGIDYWNDGKSAFFTNGNGNILDIIYLMYGKEIKEI